MPEELHRTEVTACSSQVFHYYAENRIADRFFRRFDMKIELTKEQYRKLVELVYLGNWLVNAHREAGECLQEYEESEQHFLSFYK